MRMRAWHFFAGLSIAGGSPPQRAVSFCSHVPIGATLMGVKRLFSALLLSAVASATWQPGLRANPWSGTSYRMEAKALPDQRSARPTITPTNKEQP